MLSLLDPLVQLQPLVQLLLLVVVVVTFKID
jgi:hypothetical protein